MQDALSTFDVLTGVGDADTGDRHSGCGRQISQTVRTRAAQFAGIGKEYPDVTIGLVPAVAGLTQGAKYGIAGLVGLGSIRVAEVTCWSVHSCRLGMGTTWMSVQVVASVARTLAVFMRPCRRRRRLGCVPGAAGWRGRPG
jgi:hypothetical protein